jgi:hypothetical protein
MIAWFLKYWKELLGAGIIIALLAVLAFERHRGELECEAKNKAAIASQLISNQQDGLKAVDADLLAAQQANDKEQKITQTIGQSHDETKPPALIVNTIGSLYAK